MEFWEPKSTNDMVFHDDQTEIIIKKILDGRLSFGKYGNNGLILYGPYGTGKTTYAKIFCEEFELLKSNSTLKSPPKLIRCKKSISKSKLITGCEDQAKLISENKSGLHYFIFDEVDNLTAEIQHDLKLFLGWPGVIAVLTTNHLNEIDEGLVNRCVEICFNAGDQTRAEQRVRTILQRNGRTISNVALDAVFGASDGSWRKLLLLAETSSVPLSNPNQSASATP